MSGPDWVYVTNEDDWCGLYCDGELYAQGHDIYWPGFIKKELMPGSGMTFEEKVVDIDWLDQEGQLPKLLDDVVLFETDHPENTL